MTAQPNHGGHNGDTTVGLDAEPGGGRLDPGTYSDADLLACCQRLALLYARHAARRSHGRVRDVDRRLVRHVAGMAANG